MGEDQGLDPIEHSKAEVKFHLFSLPLHHLNGFFGFNHYRRCWGYGLY